ncbi:MAG: class I SAM-dependent DNA methyltransferase [Actinomycetota bacterium]
MFDKTPQLYDEIYGRMKNYEAEASHAIELIEERNPNAKTLLDVACGTGQHLAWFSKRFECEGLDLDPNLLGIARTRNTEIPLHLGDMISFDLRKTFDVVTCLFSAIGYVVTLEKLRAAIKRMSVHLNPGGVLIIEPWLYPEMVELRNIHADFIDEPELKVARISRVEVDGRVSNVIFEYLIGTPDAITRESEVHVTGLFTRDEYQSAMEDAGISDITEGPRLSGLGGRGLFVGVKNG